jgi:fumarylacetoacetate (FAA) hydrolase family protein
MKGYGHEQFQGALTISETSEGQMEASILGNDVSSHDIEKKKAELEEMKAYNFFSSIGKALAQLLTNITETIIQFIAGFITNMGKP